MDEHMKELAKSYFLEKDHNCAEATLLTLGALYGFPVSEEDYKLVSAFGAGMGCKRTCGALCGALAAYGRLKVNGRAHATEGFGEGCAGLVAAFERELGSIDCAVLIEKYRREDVRCLETVERAVDCFCRYVD